MERAVRLDGFHQAITAFDTLDGKDHPTTRLWAVCEEVATITHTTPKRWLRYGIQTLTRALIYLNEKPDVKNPGAFLTWAIKHYHG